LPRPIKPRWVEFFPNVTYFKPAGMPLSTLDEVSLGIDELEALRLKDVLGLEQEQCAERMKVAQSTFQRILTMARAKVASALVEGKAIRIEGGHYRFWAELWECLSCGYRWQSESPDKVLSTCPDCGSSDIRPSLHEGQHVTDQSQTQMPMDFPRPHTGPMGPRGPGFGRGRGPHRGPKRGPGGGYGWGSGLW